MAQGLHIGMGDGCGTSLDKIHLVGKGCQLSGSKLYEDPDAGRYQEGGHLGSRILEGFPELADVFQPVNKDEGGT